MGRACWDWVAPIDLAGASRIAFDVSATNGGLAGNVGVYFGTPDGWYARFGWGGMPDTWTQRVERLDIFGSEGEPGGWDKVNTFRFSVWSTGPGKATFRLRNLRALPADPAEGLITNGSFEIPGVGVPYGWGSGHWGVGDLPWAADMDLWRSRWFLDHSVARHGDTSLCIDNRPDLPLLKAHSLWFTPPISDETYTASVWLRSDTEGLPVTLQCGGAEAQVEVGGEWSQASLPGVEPGKRSILIIAPQAVGKLWIDAAQLQALPEATPEFHASFADEPIAAREALVDWSPPRRAFELPTETVPEPLQAASAEVDEHARFLLDGKPYIQHSLGLEYVKDLDILDFVARSGFRDVCYQVRPAITTQRLTEVFDRCEKVGLRIIPWLDGNMSREQFTQHIETLKNHPALLCWYVYDEPSGPRFAEADARYRLARELDPNHPALINYLGDKLQDHTGDIYSTDVYPIPRSSPTAAIGAVRNMAAAAAPEGKPVWMWLQGTGYAYWMDREPSPRELSCMVYGSLIEGARGIYYFAQVPRTRECWDEMRAMCLEVDTLTAPLSSLDPAPELTSDTGTILCRAYALANELWVLAVNTQNAPAEASFTLAGASGEVTVTFENRTLQARADSWSDSFGPYERHVYRLPAP